MYCIFFYKQKTAYELRISDWSSDVCSSDLCSAYSASKTTVVTHPPAGPPTLTAPATDNNGAFTVSWTGVSTATNYRLEQRKDSGAWSQIYSGTGLGKAVSGLANGAYGYRVRACNAGGCSAYSESKTTAVRSEEHTSELQSLMRISYAVFCLKKKK